MGCQLGSVDLGRGYDDRGIEDVSNDVDDRWEVGSRAGREDS